MIVRVAGSLLVAAALVGCGGGGGGGGTPPVTENPVPTLTSISPTSTAVGGAAFTLAANGFNFISGSVVRWNGSGRTTTFVGSTQLTASILASDIAALGTAQVTVFNPAPGGGPSTALTFTIGNPVPTMSSISPSSATAGRPAFTLTVNGSDFISSSVVRWKGVGRETTYMSNEQLTAAILPGDIGSAGTAELTVFNPTPGGGISSPLDFTVAEPVAITTTWLADTTGGKPYNYTLGSTGGLPAITWELISGALPDGLSLEASTGKISGWVDPVIGLTTANFTVQATDSVTTPSIATQPLSILVHVGNDVCTPGTTAGTTPIPNNDIIRASISPYGDIDVYSFSGTAGAQVTIETFAQRLDLDGDPFTQDSYLDSIVELLDSNCNQLTYNDDIIPVDIKDSLIKNYTLPSDGTYFIRVRDFYGDGRPDLIYELSLAGAN